MCWAERTGPSALQRNQNESIAPRRDVPATLEETILQPASRSSAMFATTRADFTRTSSTSSRVRSRARSFDSERRDIAARPASAPTSAPASSHASPSLLLLPPLLWPRLRSRASSSSSSPPIFSATRLAPRSHPSPWLDSRDATFFRRASVSRSRPSS